MKPTTRNKFIHMGVYPGAVTVRCPQCRRSYMRVFREYDGGFGFCVDHPTIKVLRASSLREDEKRKAKREKIQAELNGIQI